MLLKWDAALMSTGVDEVDRQHQKLIEHINELYRLMKEGHGTDGITEFVDFLSEYAESHFRHEEGCMAQHRCPAAMQNKLQHIQFSRTLSDFRRRLVKDGPTGSLAIEVQRNVGEWMRNHILRTDIELRGCVHTVEA